MKNYHYYYFQVEPKMRGWVRCVIGVVLLGEYETGITKSALLESSDSRTVV